MFHTPQGKQAFPSSFHSSLSPVRNAPSPPSHNAHSTARLKLQIDAILQNDLNVLRNHPEASHKTLLTACNNPLIMRYVRKIYEEYGLQDPLPGRKAAWESKGNLGGKNSLEDLPEQPLKEREKKKSKLYPHQRPVRPTQKLTLVKNSLGPQSPSPNFVVQHATEHTPKSHAQKVPLSHHFKTQPTERYSSIDGSPEGRVLFETENSREKERRDRQQGRKMVKSVWLSGGKDATPVEQNKQTIVRASNSYFGQPSQQTPQLQLPNSPMARLAPHMSMSQYETSSPVRPYYRAQQPHILINVANEEDYHETNDVNQGVERKHFHVSRNQGSNFGRPKVYFNRDVRPPIQGVRHTDSRIVSHIPSPAVNQPTISPFKAPLAPQSPTLPHIISFRNPFPAAPQPPPPVQTAPRSPLNSSIENIPPSNAKEVPEVYRYCIGCTQALLESNIVFHQLKCKEFQKVLQMPEKYIVDTYLKEKLQQFQTNISRHTSQLSQKDKERIQRHTGQVLKQSRKIVQQEVSAQDFSKGEGQAYKYRLEYDKCMGISQKWMLLTQEINKNNWFLRLRQNIRDQLGMKKNIQIESQIEMKGNEVE